MKITSAETYQREIGNLLMIKDNYPKYIITLDPMSSLVANSGIVVRPLREFLLDKTL